MDQEIFEWDILEHYYRRNNGDDLLELCTIFNTGELLSLEVELIENEIDIDSIKEMELDVIDDVTYYINDLIKAVKQIDKRVKKLEGK